MSQLIQRMIVARELEAKLMTTRTGEPLLAADHFAGGPTAGRHDGADLDFMQLVEREA